MGAEFIKALTEEGGIIGLLMGVPLVSLATAVIVLYKQTLSTQEKLIKLIEQKVQTDTQMTAALNSLKDMLQIILSK
jgi:uncharacterized membrane protein YczE